MVESSKKQVDSNDEVLDFCKVDGEPVRFGTGRISGVAGIALSGYEVIVTLQATLVHANLRFTFGPLRYFLVTPQFHHWHHSDQPEAIDKNFAIHLPIWDWMFGSYHLPPQRWPEHYGVQGDHLPEGFSKQFLWSFKR